MDGLDFINAAPAAPVDPARMDITCFIGLAARRSAGSVSADRARLESCLNELGWQGPSLDPGLGSEARLVPDLVEPEGDSAQAFGNWLQGLSWTPKRPGQATTVPVSQAYLFRSLLGVWFDPSIASWFIERGLLDPAANYGAADLLELLDVPVPIETWNAFDSLFAWDTRPIKDLGSQPVVGQTVDTLLGAAVRSFFRQGGRKCYVVRVDDPKPVLSAAADRAALVPRFLPALTPTSADRSTWRGLGNLLGLPELSFLCLPDAPELFAADTQALPAQADVAGPERFVECGSRVEPSTFQSLRSIPTARCDAAGFGAWAQFVRVVGTFLARQAREVQFVAAVPLPANAVSLASIPAVVAQPREQQPAEIASRMNAARLAQWNQISANLQSAFVQLAYPWLHTFDSDALPEQLEPPDGTLAGMLANVALTQGAWQTPARQAVPGLRAVEPILSREILEAPLPFRNAGTKVQGQGPGYQLSLRQRISLFGPTAIGLRLLSDVTTAAEEAWRPAPVNRLMNVIIRAARQAGEELVFNNNGERLWAQVVDSLTRVLAQLWADGALDGTTAAEAFEVRCDQSTMTQADLDAGRLITRVQFTAAAPIERIVAMLALSEGGQVSLVSASQASPSAGQQEAA